MKGFDTHLLRLQPPSPPSLSNGFLPQRQSVNNLKVPNFRPRSPSMLKVFSSSTASRAHHHLSPAIRPGASSVESPFFKALSHLTGLNRRSTSLGGRRVFFCSDNASDAAAAAAAEAEAKAAESDSDGADAKSSSAIVPTNPRPEDCLTVSSNCIQTQLNLYKGCSFMDGWLFN